MKKRIPIIILGANGRMGKTLLALLQSSTTLEAAVAVDREFGPEKLAIPCVRSLAEAHELAPEAMAIDFTAAAASLEAARYAAANNVALVIGSTGLDSGQKEELADCARKTPILYSANMSIGVNVLASLLPRMIKALGPQYDLEMMEIHHRHKKDAPSGTALMLAEEMARAKGWEDTECLCKCRNGLIGERPVRQIGIQALRGGDVPGIHTIYFFGPGEFLQLGHTAESRENFAQGALRAALWLAEQKAGRLYNMGDVLGLA